LFLFFFQVLNFLFPLWLVCALALLLFLFIRQILALELVEHAAMQVIFHPFAQVVALKSR
jgi:hypothetical protein